MECSPIIKPLCALPFECFVASTPISFSPFSWNTDGQRGANVTVSAETSKISPLDMPLPRRSRTTLSCGIFLVGGFVFVIGVIVVLAAVAVVVAVVVAVAVADAVAIAVDDDVDDVDGVVGLVLLVATAAIAAAAAAAAAAGAAAARIIRVCPRLVTVEPAQTRGESGGGSTGELAKKLPRSSNRIPCTDHRGSTSAD